jgi:hypothetical protein
MNKMTIEVEFPEHDWASFHDVVWDATGKEDWTNEQLKELFLFLPRDIQHTAFQWGLSDTPFKDDAYVYLQENYHKFTGDKH